MSYRGKLARYDVVDYFSAQLETLSPQLLKEKHIKELRKGILELRDMMDIPDGRDIPEAEVKKFLEKAQKLVKIAAS